MQRDKERIGKISPCCIYGAVREMKKPHRAIDDSKTDSDEGIDRTCDYSIN
jgi:hypothetical protein